MSAKQFKKLLKYCDKRTTSAEFAQSKDMLEWAEKIEKNHRRIR